jgi:hypothetical protein
MSRAKPNPSAIIVNDDAETPTGPILEQSAEKLSRLGRRQSR